MFCSKHFCQFADSAFDKIDAWLGRITTEQVTYNDPTFFSGLVERRQGAIFIGSHLGNLEVCRALSRSKYDTAINVLVYTHHAVKFNRLISKIATEANINLIQVTSLDPYLAMTLKEKVDNGEMVIIVGDRTSTTTFERSTNIDFLGKPAPFSQGPFILAALLECPIYFIFCMKQKEGYQLIFETPEQPPKMTRKNRQQVLQSLMQQYVRILEKYTIRFPYQWYNFYDFWHQNSNP